MGGASRPEVRKEDIAKLNEKLGRVVARIVADLYKDAYVGEECDPEHYTVPLPHCYKVKFDETGYVKAGEEETPGWRPDWRFIYRIEDGEVKVVAVVAMKDLNLVLRR